ncbi:MAG: MmcQ/YjbR family DNA-binding protein [Sphingobacteriaceae bacterium]|jgi:predicted DNA-binding protein (MmcQ/YjbR family)|nr:MAG: MmcQ/YjbR family DNA-binding protein [Pedobacter sp.]
MGLNIESIREYCLAKPAVQETFPFDENTLVFKVFDKMFLLIRLDDPSYFSVKCDPKQAVLLREKYTEIRPGYHLNKKHWNTVCIIGRFNDTQLLEMIDHSYQLVLQGIPKSKKSG